MTLILFPILFIVLIVVAPVMMILRSFWGWRYGLFVVFAWIAGLVLHTEALQSMLWFLDMKIPFRFEWFHSGDLWKQVDAVANFPIQKTFFNPSVLGLLYLVGAVLLPVQLLIMGFLKLQGHPAGATGHFSIDNQDSSAQSRIIIIVFIILIAFILLAETETAKMSALNSLTTLAIPLIGLLIVGALGGKHRRIMVLDKSMSFGSFGFKKRKKQFQPFEKPSGVRVHTPKKVASAKIGLEHIFADRPQALADMVR
jgi:hypothetical protein